MTTSPTPTCSTADLFRNELLLRRTPPGPEVIAEIVDDVFFPLIRP